MNIPTAELLARALIEAKAPPLMIERARAYYYDDYKGPLATPMTTLYTELTKLHLHRLAERVKNGDFDAQRWEAKEWAESAEGKECLKGINLGSW